MDNQERELDIHYITCAISAVSFAWSKGEHLETDGLSDAELRVLAENLEALVTLGAAKRYCVTRHDLRKAFYA